MKAKGLFALALASGLIAACGSNATPVGQVTSPSPSATASAIASPTPAPGVCDASHRCLALVTLRGSDSIVVRDITDIDHPKTVGNLGSNIATFVSATELSYSFNGGIVTAPLSGSPRTPVAGAAKGAGGPVWSPDGTAVVYTTERGSYETGDQKLDVHLLRDGADRIVGSTPGLGAGDCQSVMGCGFENWLDVRLAFSPDGEYFSFVAQGFGTSFFYLWSSDGTPIKSDSTHPFTMSAWSAQSLYFRDASGVEAWREGAISTFLPRVQWIKPRPSPAGGSVVYTVRDSAGWGHVRLVDTATRKVRELKAQKSDAAFLTSRYVWYRGERACVAADQCGPHPPFHPDNGKTYIYDLQTGVEYSSIITGVYDVWPHGA
jgi:WD40-like Beta Propeller Repeat